MRLNWPKAKLGSAHDDLLAYRVYFIVLCHWASINWFSGSRWKNINNLLLFCLLNYSVYLTSIVFPEGLTCTLFSFSLSYTPHHLHCSFLPPNGTEASVVLEWGVIRLMRSWGRDAAKWGWLSNTWSGFTSKVWRHTWCADTQALQVLSLVLHVLHVTGMCHYLLWYTTSSRFFFLIKVQSLLLLSSLDSAA